MKIMRVYAGGGGQSHFDEIEVEIDTSFNPAKVSCLVTLMPTM
jgi:hypothetical protein